jgi:glycosyltransferase involved in cell wall biosynthesis
VRIALVSPGYPPTAGGVEAVVAQQARALRRSGHTVEVFAQERRPDLVGLTVDDGVVVHRFATAGPHDYPVAPTLWRALSATSGFDVVHGHSYHTLTGMAAALRARAPFVFSPHYHGTGHSPFRAVLHRGYRPIGRLAFTRAAAVVCVSRVEADLVARHFPAAAARTAVVPNAVDAKAIAAATPFAGEPPTVLSVGRLERYKRVDRIIRAFAAVAPPAQLVVIGAGPDRDRLERLAAASDPESGQGDRIRFLGRVADAELHRWLRTCQVLCGMSEHEAFGLAPAEALAAGAAVVLSDIPAHAELSAALSTALSAAGPVRLVGATEPAEALAGHLMAALSSTHASARIPDWDDVAGQLAEVYARVAPDRAGATA